MGPAVQTHIMVSPTPGVHHVTSIASDPVENLAFYTDTLGLRLVKKSINQDDISVYHLFYADHDGSPGTSMTFFPYQGASQGQVGTGQVHTTQFTVPADSIDWWADRLEEKTPNGVERTEYFGDPVLAFTDPDGLKLALVGVADPPASNIPESPVPAEHTIRGFHGIALGVSRPGRFPQLLERFGYENHGTDGNRTRFTSHGELGAVVDILELEGAPRGQPGAGTVHHVAFYVETEEQEDWRDLLVEEGLRPTEVIDRKWFYSVYTRTPAGILFEFATPDPGYDIDEDIDALGEQLVLPEWFEDQREQIEAGLPELPDPGF